MNMPYTFLFDSLPLLVKNKRPKWSSIRFPKVQEIRYFDFKTSEFCSQVANFFPFYIELLEFNNKSNFQFKYKVDSSQHFLTLQIKGNVTFYTSNGFFVSHAKQGHFALIYNNTGVFEVRMKAGIYSTLCISINQDWLRFASASLPEIEIHLQRVFQKPWDFALLPYCYMNADIRSLLIEIHSKLSNGIGSIDGFLRLHIARILERYELLAVEKKLSIPYQVLDFINKNFCDPDLNTHSIAGYFQKTERNLRNQFKTEFNITMRYYYTSCRVCYAHYLIQNKNLSVSEVYSIVGYNDESTLRYELRKFRA